MFSAVLVPSLLLAWASSAVTARAICRTCELKGIDITGLPESFPKPTLPLAFVSVAIGTQNYTCSEHGNYTAAGAVAELYDISCLAHGSSSSSPEFLKIQNDVFAGWKDAPAGKTAREVGWWFDSVLGHQGQHYFIPNPQTGQGLSAKWDFTSTGRTNGVHDAFVVVSRLAGAKAPTGAQDIDWLALASIDGGLGKEVYRTDTVEGQPPSATCKPGSGDVQVKYASKYWFYGASDAVNSRMLSKDKKKKTTGKWEHA